MLLLLLLLLLCQWGGRDYHQSKVKVKVTFRLGMMLLKMAFTTLKKL